MPGDSIRRISSEADVRRLASFLLDPQRSRPVAVVSTRSGESDPWIDVAELADRVGDLADIWVVPTSSLSWRLSDLLPTGTQVYGGAARVYPVDQNWQKNPFDSPLHLLTRREDSPRVTDQLISDAMTMAVKAGLLASSTSSTAATKPTHRGVVAGLVGEDRALVALDNGAMATIWRELTMPGVKIGDLLAPGQPVSGILDPVSGRLDVRDQVRGQVEALRAYCPGDVILTQVERVQQGWVVVRPHPNPASAVRLGAAAVTGTESDNLADLFSPGEVVAARVVSVEPMQLRMDDLSPKETARPAPAILPGGPPWLQPPPPPPEPPPPPVAAPTPTPVAVADLADDGVPNPRDVIGRMAARKAGVPYIPPPRPKPKPVPAPPPVSQDQVAEATPPAHPKPGPPGGVAATPATPAKAAVRPKPGPPGAQLTGLAGLADQPTATSQEALAAEPVMPAAPSAPPEPTRPKPGPRPGPGLAAPEKPSPAPTSPGPTGPTAPTAAELANLVEVWRNRSAKAQERIDELEERVESFAREREWTDQQARELAEDRNRLNHEIVKLRTKLRQAQGTMRDLRRAPAAPGASDPRDEIAADRFLDPEEQLRWEIYLAWVLRVMPQEKADYPLRADYGIGEGFIDSLDKLQGVDRSKVMDVIVEVLTDRAAKTSGRRVHPLRSSSGGGVAQRQRPDGSAAWRVSLQRGTPAARHLHYWQRGTWIELDSVGVHDDGLV